MSQILLMARGQGINEWISNWVFSPENCVELSRGYLSAAGSLRVPNLGKLHIRPAPSSNFHPLQEIHIIVEWRKKCVLFLEMQCVCGALDTCRLCGCHCWCQFWLWKILEYKSLTIIWDNISIRCSKQDNISENLAGIFYSTTAWVSIQLCTMDKYNLHELPFLHNFLVNTTKNVSFLLQTHIRRQCQFEVQGLIWPKIKVTVLKMTYSWGQNIAEISNFLSMCDTHR